MLTHQCFTVIQISSKVEGSHRLCIIDGAYTMQNWRLNVTWVTCTCVVLIALRGTNKEDAGCWEEIGCRHARLLGWPRGVCNCSQHEGSCDFWVNSDVMMWASWLPWLVSWEVSSLCHRSRVNLTTWPPFWRWPWLTKRRSDSRRNSPLSPKLVSQLRINTTTMPKRSLVSCISWSLIDSMIIQFHSILACHFHVWVVPRQAGGRNFNR